MTTLLRNLYGIALLVFVVLPVCLIGQETPKNLTASVDSLNALASRHAIFGKNSRNTTLRYASEALALSEKIGYKYGMLQALDVITYWTIIVGNIEEALLYGFRQLRLAEEVGQPLDLARALRNVGFAAGQQSKIDSSARRQAQANLRRSLAIALSIGDTLIEVSCLNSLGRLSRLEKDWTKARELHEKALRGARAIGSLEQEGWALHSIASIYESRRLYDSAMLYAQHALAIRAAAKDDFGEALSLRLIALLHFQQKHYPAALRCVQQSIEKCNRHEGFFIAKVQAYRLLVAICKEMGDSDGELRAYRNFIIVKDSADANEAQKSPAMLQAQLEIERQEHEKELLLRDKRIQEIQIQRQRIIGLGATGGAVVLILIVLFLVRNARIRKQQHAQLQEAYREIQRQKDILEAQAKEIEVSNMVLAENNIELSAANERLTALNTEKDEIMSIVAHDLKNPIATITGFTDILRTEELSREHKDTILDQLYTAGNRMLELVKNVLDSYRMESGAMEMQLVSMNIEPVVSMSVAMYRERAAQKNITLWWEKPNTDIIVLADERMFNQVFDNLLSNAVKYSPHGKNVFVRVKSSVNAVRVEVQDEGPGISEEDMQRLFGKFARLSARPTGGEHSTGLGLSIVKKMVEAMQGRVWCESELGKGATFVVELPKGQATVILNTGGTG